MTPTTFNRRSSTTDSTRVSHRSPNSARRLAKTVTKVCVWLSDSPACSPTDTRDRGGSRIVVHPDRL